MIAPHTFDESLARSKEAGVLPFWNEAYRNAFPDLIGICRHDADGFWQREGIDVSITLANTKQILIDEKVRFRNKLTGKIYDDIALEVWSDRDRKLKGWLQKSIRADYIAYAIAPLGICYLLPVLQLQQAWNKWGKEWISFYKTIGSRNYGPSRSWVTESVCMPAEHVFWAIEQCLKVSFKPIEEP
jgi:hypothetical protein